MVDNSEMIFGVRAVIEAIQAGKEIDKILVKKQNTARNGEIVVALVDDSATIKTFYKEDGHYRLQPENDTMDPIIVDRVEILGKLAGLYRTYR